MRRNDVYLASFPFGDSAATKLRPVLLLSSKLGSVPEVLVAYISSVIPHNLLPTDIVLDPESPEASSTHLKTKSTCAYINLPPFTPALSSAAWALFLKKPAQK